MNLRGDRNQCPTCGRYFNSTAAFEKHRVGDIGRSSEKRPNPYGTVRRCMTTGEMLARGMAINAAGFWITAERVWEAAEPKIADETEALDDEIQRVRVMAGLA
jgi:hypothetical protein